MVKVVITLKSSIAGVKVSVSAEKGDMTQSEEELAVEFVNLLNLILTSKYANVINLDGSSMN